MDDPMYTINRAKKPDGFANKRAPNPMFTILLAVAVIGLVVVSWKFLT